MGGLVFTERALSCVLRTAVAPLIRGNPPEGEWLLLQGSRRDFMAIL